MCFDTYEEYLCEICFEDSRIHKRAPPEPYCEPILAEQDCLPCDKEVALSKEEKRPPNPAHCHRKRKTNLITRPHKYCYKHRKLYDDPWEAIPSLHTKILYFWMTNYNSDKGENHNLANELHDMLRNGAQPNFIGSPPSKAPPRYVINKKLVNDIAQELYDRIHLPALYPPEELDRDPYRFDKHYQFWMAYHDLLANYRGYFNKALAVQAAGFGESGKKSSNRKYSTSTINQENPDRGHSREKLRGAATSRSNPENPLVLMPKPLYSPGDNKGVLTSDNVTMFLEADIARSLTPRPPQPNTAQAPRPQASVASLRSVDAEDRRRREEQSQRSISSIAQRLSGILKVDDQRKETKRPESSRSSKKDGKRPARESGGPSRRGGGAGRA